MLKSVGTTVLEFLSLVCRGEALSGPKQDLEAESGHGGKYLILTDLSQEPVDKHSFVLPKTINPEDTLDVV